MAGAKKMSDTGAFLFVSLVFVAFMAAATGWVINIVKIVTTGFQLSQWGGLEVARVIGVFFAPLGAVLGWM